MSQTSPLLVTQGRTEEALMAAYVRHRDLADQSFNRIHSQSAGWVRWYMVQRGVPSADVEDLVQKVYGNLSQLRSFDSTKKLRSLLHVIERNVATDYFRAINRRERGLVVSLPLEDLLATVPIDRLRLTPVWACIKKLPKDLRFALILRKVFDFGVVETAEMLGCSVGAVTGRVNRALALLRKCLLSHPAKAQRLAA